MSFLSSSRCVLILGDEGLQIFNVGRFGARLVDFVPWDTVEFETTVSDLIVNRCKRKPIVILNDMVEQHYRKERVPNVGVMDRANVLKRRLSVAFPNYKIRAALKLDDKKSNLPKDGKGTAYLFAAISASESFSKTMRAIHLSSAQIVGFYLLPIEASEMVKAISAKISRNSKTKAAWTIFMGQHQNGGVRQIVTRDGELALTRMTPIVDTDVEPELWAKEISAELNATMSYLSRFGYKETDGLNVVIIGNENTEEPLTSIIEIECNLQVLTSQQAGQLLGVNVGQQSDLRYADPLHAAYLGQKRKFRLPVQVGAIDRIVKPKRIASFVILGLLAVCAYSGYEAFSVWAKSMKAEEELRVTEERKKSVKHEYDLEVAKKKAIGFDFVLVSNSVELFDAAGVKKIKPLLALKEIGQSLGADLHLDKLDVKAVKQKKPLGQRLTQYSQDNSHKDAEEKTIMEIVMTLSFDSELAPDIGVRKVNELKDNIQRRLPNYNVEIVKQVANLTYTGNFVGEAGTASSDDEEPEDYEAEIIVRGPMR